MLKKLLSLVSIGLVGTIMTIIWMTSDTTPPTITIPNDTLAIACADMLHMLRGVSAYDNKLDISNQVTIENMREIELKQAIFVTYVVEDKAGNVAKAERRISYTMEDLIEVIQIKEPIVLATSQTDFPIQDYYQANNGCGMDVSDDLYLEGNYDISLAGTYPVTLLLENNPSYVQPIQIVVKADTDASTVNPSIDPNHNVIDNNNPLPNPSPVQTTNPPIFLFHENPVTLKINTTFAYMNPIQTIEDDVDDFAFLARRIRVTNYPNMTVAGTYVVTYAVSNSSGVDGSAQLTVYVVDDAVVEEQPIVTEPASGGDENEDPLIEE